MKDQASVGNESYARKISKGIGFIYRASVLKPDHDLRGCSHNQGCFNELMEIREHVLEYLKTLKEVTHHTQADESDELETEKLIAVKDKIAVETKPLQNGDKIYAKSYKSS